jgi:hypothetical protein
MSSVGLEPTIAAGERPQTYALERAATGTWKYIFLTLQNFAYSKQPLGASFTDLSSYQT